MRSEERHALLDIRHNVCRALTITESLTLVEFRQDWLRFYAATRCLEIISEASRRLSTDLIVRHPSYRWRAMRDAGNRYRHEYDGVAEELVFTTINDDLAPLLAIVEQELAAVERR